MIHRASGDILKQEADALVNTVNCVGVIGRGIALQFRRAFDDNYKAYRTAAKHGEIRPGQMFVFAIQVSELIEGFESPYGLEAIGHRALGG